MASLEQRIKYLFFNSEHKKFSQVAESTLMVARIFAERRGQWLTNEDVIRLTNCQFGDSTIRKAFKKLSSPLDSSDGFSFIDTEEIKKAGKGRPIIRGRISEAASDKLFSLVKRTKKKPPAHKLRLSGIGQVEIPPLKTRDEYVSPEDMIAFREQRIGKEVNLRHLRKIVKANPIAEGLPNKAYTERSRIRVSEHRAGPFPKRVSITDIGFIELAADEWPLALSASIILEPVSEPDTNSMCGLPRVGLLRACAPGRAPGVSHGSTPHVHPQHSSGSGSRP